MQDIAPGEIVYATITLKDEKNRIHELRKVIFSREWNCAFPLLDISIYGRFLKQNNLKNNATVVDVDIIARTGFKHKDKGYTTAKKNEQVRDDITGAYV
tara:strand:- start:363 stop:659 length:297 start_codon:yes stop_codon:yes gene_type:complete